MPALTINIPWSHQSQDRVDAFSTLHADYLVLADGAGGIGGGAEAAKRFVTRVREIALNADRADQALSSLARLDGELEADPECGETTGVVVAITSTEIRCASVGDSEAWLVKDAQVIRLTEGQRRKPLLGSGLATPAHGKLSRRGGILLVASDGLFRYAGSEKILAALSRGVEPSTPEALVLRPT